MRESERYIGNQQGILMVTEVELGWLAGMIDGEGTIAFSVYRTKEQVVRAKPQVIITGTDRVMIEKVADICQRLEVGAHIETREPRSGNFVPRAKFKTAYVVNVCGFKRARKLLAIVVPHLVGVKQKKGEMVLRYIDQRTTKIEAHGRWAGLDVEDITLMQDIVAYASIHNGKGPGSRNFGMIEELLRDITHGELPKAA